MHPPVPRGTAIQVFPSTGSIHLTKPEMLENLKAKLATTRAACDQGGDLIASIFGIAPKVAQDFANAVHAALTVGLPQQIEFLENLPDPEPVELPQGMGQFDPYRPSVEQLASAEMTVQNFEEQIGKIEEVAERDDLPPGVGALMGMGVPMLRQQLQQATEHRDYLRAAIERWEKANQ